MILIGHKTLALFDLWSLFHFLAGIAIGNLCGPPLIKLRQR